ncbi:hypothetical protein B0H14DRAFT_3532409 [Mycena olivaceomarginata]|nr:hypothetical protein B0H14DRAFT_3532409 [Mycena olivaceomarginata]
MFGHRGCAGAALVGDKNTIWEYFQDVAKPKGKGKAAAVELSNNTEDPFLVVSDDDEDQNKDKTPNGHITPWEVAVLSALEGGHAGKKMSSIFKAIGDQPKSVRDTNSWNTYQMKYRVEHPRPLKKHGSSNSLDIEIFGLVLDCFSNNAIIWGGGALFQQVFKQHPVPIRKFLIDMKVLFQMTLAVSAEPSRNSGSPQHDATGSHYLHAIDFGGQQP